MSSFARFTGCWQFNALCVLSLCQLRRHKVDSSTEVMNVRETLANYLRGSSENSADPQWKAAPLNNLHFHAEFDRLRVSNWYFVCLCPFLKILFPSRQRLRPDPSVRWPETVNVSRWESFFFLLSEVVQHRQFVTGPSCLIQNERSDTVRKIEPKHPVILHWWCRLEPESPPLHPLAQSQSELSCMTLYSTFQYTFCTNFVLGVILDSWTYDGHKQPDSEANLTLESL